jgi:hypothetical protein
VIRADWDGREKEEALGRDFFGARWIGGSTGGNGPPQLFGPPCLLEGWEVVTRFGTWHLGGTIEFICWKMVFILEGTAAGRETTY